MYKNDAEWATQLSAHLAQHAVNEVPNSVIQQANFIYKQLPPIHIDHRALPNFMGPPPRLGDTPTSRIDTSKIYTIPTLRTPLAHWPDVTSPAPYLITEAENADLYSMFDEYIEEVLSTTTTQTLLNSNEHLQQFGKIALQPDSDRPNNDKYIQDFGEVPILSINTAIDRDIEQAYAISLESPARTTHPKSSFLQLKQLSTLIGNNIVQLEALLADQHSLVVNADKQLANSPKSSPKFNNNSLDPPIDPITPPTLSLPYNLNKFLLIEPLNVDFDHTNDPTRTTQQIVKNHIDATSPIERETSRQRWVRQRNGLSYGPDLDEFAGESYDHLATPSSLNDNIHNSPALDELYSAVPVLRSHPLSEALIWSLLPPHLNQHFYSPQNTPVDKKQLFTAELTNLIANLLLASDNPVFTDRLISTVLLNKANRVINPTIVFQSVTRAYNTFNSLLHQYDKNTNGFSVESQLITPNESLITSNSSNVQPTETNHQNALPKINAFMGNIIGMSYNYSLFNSYLIHHYNSIQGMSRRQPANLKTDGIKNNSAISTTDFPLFTNEYHQSYLNYMYYTHALKKIYHESAQQWYPSQYSYMTHDSNLLNGTNPPLPIQNTENGEITQKQLLTLPPCTLYIMLNDSISIVAPPNKVVPTFPKNFLQLPQKSKKNQDYKTKDKDGLFPAQSEPYDMTQHPMYPLVQQDPSFLTTLTNPTANLQPLPSMLSLLATFHPQQAVMAHNHFMNYFSQQLKRLNVQKDSQASRNHPNTTWIANKPDYSIIDNSLSIDDITAQIKRYQSVWFPYIFASLQSYIDDTLHHSGNVMTDVHSFGPDIMRDKNAQVTRRLLHTTTFSNIVNFLTQVVCAVEDINLKNNNDVNKYFQKPLFTRDMAHILKQTRVFFDFPLPGDAVLNRNDPYHPNNPNRTSLYNHLMPNLLKTETGEDDNDSGKNTNFETFGVFDAEFDHLFSELEQNVVADMNKQRLSQLFKFNTSQSLLSPQTQTQNDSKEAPTTLQLLGKNPVVKYNKVESQSFLYFTPFKKSKFTGKSTHSLSDQTQDDSTENYLNNLMPYQHQRNLFARLPPTTLLDLLSPAQHTKLSQEINMFNEANTSSNTTLLAQTEGRLSVLNNNNHLMEYLREITKVVSNVNKQTITHEAQLETGLDHDDRLPSYIRTAPESTIRENQPVRYHKTLIQRIEDAKKESYQRTFGANNGFALHQLLQSYYIQQMNTIHSYHKHKSQILSSLREKVARNTAKTGEILMDPDFLNTGEVELFDVKDTEYTIFPLNVMLDSFEKYNIDIATDLSVFHKCVKLGIVHNPGLLVNQPHLSNINNNSSNGKKRNAGMYIFTPQHAISLLKYQHLSKESDNFNQISGNNTQNEPKVISPNANTKFSDMNDLKPTTSDILNLTDIPSHDADVGSKMINLGHIKQPLLPKQTIQKAKLLKNQHNNISMMQHLITNNISLSSFLPPQMTINSLSEFPQTDPVKTQFISQQFLSTIYTSKAPIFDYNYHQYYSAHLTPNPTVVNQYFRSFTDDNDNLLNNSQKTDKKHIEKSKKKFKSVLMANTNSPDPYNVKVELVTSNMNTIIIDNDHDVNFAWNHLRNFFPKLCTENVSPYSVLTAVTRHAFPKKESKQSQDSYSLAAQHLLANGINDELSPADHMNAMSQTDSYDAMRELFNFQRTLNKDILLHMGIDDENILYDHEANLDKSMYVYPSNTTARKYIHHTLNHLPSQLDMVARAHGPHGKLPLNYNSILPSGLFLSGSHHKLQTLPNLSNTLSDYESLFRTNDASCDADANVKLLRDVLEQIYDPQTKSPRDHVDNIQLLHSIHPISCVIDVSPRNPIFKVLSESTSLTGVTLPSTSTTPSINEYDLLLSHKNTFLNDMGELNDGSSTTLNHHGAPMTQYDSINDFNNFNNDLYGSLDNIRINPATLKRNKDNLVLSIHLAHTPSSSFDFNAENVVEYTSPHERGKHKTLSLLINLSSIVSNPSIDLLLTTLFSSQSILKLASPTSSLLLSNRTTDFLSHLRKIYNNNVKSLQILRYIVSPSLFTQHLGLYNDFTTYHNHPETSPQYQLSKFSQSLLEFTQQHTGHGLNPKHPNFNDSTNSRMQYRIHFTQPEAKTPLSDENGKEYIPSTFDFMLASLYSKDPHKQAEEYHKQFTNQQHQSDGTHLDDCDELMQDGNITSAKRKGKAINPTSPLNFGYQPHHNPIPRPVVDTFINKQYHNNTTFNQSTTTALSTLQYYKLNHERYSNWFQSPLRISQIFYQFNNHMCLLSYFYNLLQFGDPLNTNNSTNPGKFLFTNGENDEYDVYGQKSLQISPPNPGALLLTLREQHKRSMGRAPALSRVPYQADSHDEFIQFDSYQFDDIHQYLSKRQQPLHVTLSQQSHNNNLHHNKVENNTVSPRKTIQDFYYEDYTNNYNNHLIDKNLYYPLDTTKSHFKQQQKQQKQQEQLGKSKAIEVSAPSIKKSQHNHSKKQHLTKSHKNQQTVPQKTMKQQLHNLVHRNKRH